MKKKIIALILILLIVGIFFIVKSREKTNPNELTLYCNIEIRQVDLSFQVSGLVSKLLKEEKISQLDGFQYCRIKSVHSGLFFLLI